MNKFLKLCLCGIFLLGAAGCGPAEKEEKPETGKIFFLEQIGSTAVAQLHAEGFEHLELNNKILAYYLTQAVIAGEPIVYHQNHRYAWEIKQILEEIITHKKGIDPKTMEAISNYTKLFWINHCQYYSRTKEKFVPKCSFEQFLQAAETARSNGARFELKKGMSLEDKLESLRETIFDPEYEPLVTAKTPPPGEDILTASANNFYGPDVSMEDLEDFDEHYPLNSRVIKTEEGRLKEKVYRAGGERDEPGLYAAELSQVIFFLEKALPYAGKQQAETLKYMIDYFRTGDPELFREANISWLQDDPVVDFIIGFIEVYKDSRGVKGEWEGVISYVNRETTQMMLDIASHAQYFENRAPWDDSYKKMEIKAPVANSIDVVTAGGGAGPMIPAGINLPNAQDIREQYGSKSVLLFNVMRDARKVTGSRAAEEFLRTEEEKELVRRYGTQAGNTLVALHEIIGHGSGKVSPELTKDPSEYLQEYYSALEEARADLMAIYNLFDPKLVETGVLPHEDAAKAGYISSAMGDLLLLRRIRTGSRIEDDHMRASHLIQTYLEEKTGAVETVTENGKTYRQVKDFELMRTGAGKLLAEIMRIKAEGDYEAAAELVNRYGVEINPELRDEVVSRCQDIRYPDYVAFVVPSLELIEENGEIQAVEISYPNDLARQQLAWSKKMPSREN